VGGVEWSVRTVRVRRKGFTGFGGNGYKEEIEGGWGLSIGTGGGEI
jgi:hypothetical protein